MTEREAPTGKSERLDKSKRRLVALYARVSTEDQTAENQIIELRDWLIRRQWEVVEIYRENETAWRAGHQHEWARLVQDARMRHFDTVAVWALDRVTRQGIGYLFEQIAKLAQYDVRLISLKEEWLESLGTMAELYTAQFAFFAKWDSDRKSERVKAGMARAKAEGKHVGRPKGKKDKKKRQRVGYFVREATKKGLM